MHQATKQSPARLLSIQFLSDLTQIDDFFVSISECCLSRKNLDDFSNLVKLIGFPLTIVCEFNYVDHIYRDTFYEFFSSKHRRVDRNCKRLFFFRGRLEKNALFQLGDEEVQDCFVGMCILKPIQVGKIGRTLLDPSKLRIPPSYVRTTTFRFLLMGMELEIEAFPYSSQDAETMTCAETTVWNIIEYYGTRYPGYRTALPSQLFEEQEKTSQERVLPSHGLTVFTISKLLKTFGFSPRIYSMESADDFRRIFHYYVESGFPLAVGLELQDLGGHAIVCIGHGAKRKKLGDLRKESFMELGTGENVCVCIDSSDLYDSYVLMDDNVCPYQLNSFQKLVSYAKEATVNTMVVPLPKRVFLEARDALAIAHVILKDSRWGITNVLPLISEVIDNQNPLVFRLFLTSSRKYRAFRSQHETAVNAREIYGAFPLPKFIWVAEISTYVSYQNKQIYGEIVLDATANRFSPEGSLLMLRYLDYWGFALPDESNQMINTRLRKRFSGLCVPYAMYENNLRLYGGDFRK